MDVKEFKDIIENIVDVKMNKQGITKFIAAKVSSVNPNGTINVYLPPDNTDIISDLLNKTGQVLNPGDSVEVCTKNGKIKNSWVAIKHGTNFVVDGGGGTITSDATPVGTIVAYGGTMAPENWLICDGSAVSRVQYAELFSAIGTSYGAGDGSTTFNLPNLKKKNLVGLDISDSSFNSVGKTGGNATHTHTTGDVTLTIDQIPSHTHTVNGGSHRHLVSSYNNTYGQGTQQNWQSIASPASVNHDYTYDNYTSYDGGHTHSVTSTGGGQAHNHGSTGSSNNYQPYVVSNYIIKAFVGGGISSIVRNTYTNSGSDAYSCSYVNNIVESGSNTNGSWVKYIDGTMICYITKDYDNLNITTAWGSVYETPRTQLGDFPQEFIDVPTITASCIGGTSVFMEALTPTKSSIGNTWFMRPVASSNTSTTICYIAIGKWK